MCLANSQQRNPTSPRNNCPPGTVPNGPGRTGSVTRSENRRGESVLINLSFPNFRLWLAKESEASAFSLAGCSDFALDVARPRNRIHPCPGCRPARAAALARHTSEQKQTQVETWIGDPGATTKLRLSKYRCLSTPHLSHRRYGRTIHRPTSQRDAGAKPRRPR